MENALMFPRLGIEITERKKTALSLLMIPVLIVGMLATAACPAQDWIQKANGIIQEASPAVRLILTLLPLFGATVPVAVVTAVTTWEPQVESGLALLDDLITQLKAAADSAKPDILSKIEAQAQVVVKNLNSILPTLHILNQPLQDKIIGIATAVVDAVNEVLLLVGVAQGKKLAVKVSRPVRDRADLRKRINDDLHAKTGDAAIDAVTAKVSLK